MDQFVASFSMCQQVEWPDFDHFTVIKFLFSERKLFLQSKNIAIFHIFREYISHFQVLKQLFFLDTAVIEMNHSMDRARMLVSVSSESMET